MSAGRMGRWRCAGITLVVCLALGLVGAASALAETVTFKYTGTEQEFKVPAGVTSANVEAVGSEGGTVSGAAHGGVGGVVRGELSVKEGEVLYVEVGGVPFNGGGISLSGASGGGASDVRTVSIGAEPSPGDEESLNSRLLVAAGGGGGGFKNFDSIAPTTCAGGPGGGAEEKGTNGTSCGFLGGEGGGAGEAGKGGAGGTGYEAEFPLSFLDGGPGQLGAGGSVLLFAGPGGGGRFGGGGGGTQGDEEPVGPEEGRNGGNGGGGGGSNLVPAGGETKLANAGEATSVSITYTLLPTSKEQCKNGGWKRFGTTFKNQGQCVSFVETGKHAA